MPAFIYQKDGFESGIHFAIGQSDFERLIEEEAVFVDKTRAIQDIIDSKDQILLFSRPRRFGKTLLMTMLKAFFEKAASSKRHLFEPLQIWQVGTKYQEAQGRYPVLFLSLKDVKEPKFEAAYGKFQGLIQRTYQDHRYLLEEGALASEDQALYERILYKNASREELEEALRTLSKWLFAYHQEPVVLLLDEYDSPIHAAYAKGYYQDMIEFMRGFMGASFKDNPHLYRGVMTGILRVAKESLFSGLNNLKVYSMLGSQYGEYFGFTQDEVDLLLKQSHMEKLRSEIKRWYNGYVFGDVEIYNPWSIINCLSDKGRIEPYWVNTADNTLIQDILAKADPQVKANLELLMKKQPIEVEVSEGMTFNTLKLEPDALYSFLLFTGYLKASSVRLATKADCYFCTLEFPNEEVLRVYYSVFEKWMTHYIDASYYHNLLKALTIGDMYEFEFLLRRYVEASMSYFDAEGQPEKFYHGFILGILVGLTETHEVRSNRESGFGRADILVIPKDHRQLGIILEFKRTDREEDLPLDADKALAQIKDRHYAQEFHALGIKEILNIGVAFFGKKILVKSHF